MTVEGVHGGSVSTTLLHYVELSSVHLTTKFHMRGLTSLAALVVRVVDSEICLHSCCRTNTLTSVLTSACILISGQSVG